MIEANCGRERQNYVTDKLIFVMGSAYAIESKDEARTFFNRMRQKFLDWNYTEFQSRAFKTAEMEIDELYSDGNGSLEYEAECLLRGGE